MTVVDRLEDTDELDTTAVDVVGGVAAELVEEVVEELGREVVELEGVVGEADGDTEIVVCVAKDVVAGIDAEPVSDTIVITLMAEVGLRMLEGREDVIEIVEVADTGTETTFVVVIVTVRVPIVSAIAPGIPEHILYTLVVSDKS